MFSIILAWCIFVATSLQFAAAAWYCTTEDYKLKKAVAALAGHRVSIFNAFNAFMFTAWAVSGVYLFG